MTLKINTTIPLVRDSWNSNPDDLEITRNGDDVEIEMDGRTIEVSYDLLRQVVGVLRMEGDGECATCSRSGD